MPLRRATVDPLTALDISDDFASAIGTSGQVGVLGWNFTGGTFGNQNSEANHPGIYRRDTSATISTTAYTFLKGGGVTSMPILASDFFDMTWVFRLNQTDADTRARLGVSSDFSADAPVSAIYLEKKLADTQFFGAVRAVSTESRTAALATSDTAWHKIRIRRIDAGTIGFALDGGAEVTLNTNVPGAVGVNPGHQIFNNVAVSKTMDVDFFRLRVTGLVR